MLSIAPALAQTTAPTAAPDEVIIGITPAPATTGSNWAMASAQRLEARKKIQETLGTVTGEMSGIGALRVKLRGGIKFNAARSTAANIPGVRYVEPNYVLQAYSTPNDAYYGNNQWGVRKVQADQAWPLWSPQAPTVIAIIDTGVTLSHPDLSGKLHRDGVGSIVGYDFVNNDSDPADDHGHGTHCAGIAAAQINNGTGVSGIAGWSGGPASDTSNTRIMPVKVLGSNGNGFLSAVANGIIFAADRGAKVISLSLGGTNSSTTLANAISYAWNKGCIIVAAAGNDSTSAMNYPAAYPNVISVAATNSSDALAGFSNYGSWVTVAAPGESIYSTYLNNGYAWMSGTSMATPMVAGEVALLASQAPSLTNSQLRAAVIANTDPVNLTSGKTLGGGRINVLRALRAVTPSPSGGGAPTVSASFVSLDTTTQGNWPGAYGKDGYQLAGSSSVNPSYGTVTLTNHASWTWANPTTELRALVKPGSTERISACWYNGSAFNIRVNNQDSNTHRVSLYLLDGGGVSGGRRARVEAWNTATNVKLGEQLVSNFQNGAYVLWNVQGDVTFKIVALNGNAVTSAVFFDPVAATGGAPSVSASFVRLDSSTQGTWAGTYGAEGYHISGAAAVDPSYSTLTFANHSSWTWANPTTALRALTKPGSSDRIASCWFSNQSFNVRVNNRDSNTHRVALYLLDWDNAGGGRQVRVEAWNTATNTKLGEQVVTGFQNGSYVVWNVQGDVTFKIVALKGNAVVSGVFFDPAGS
jgi:thermitase